MTEEQLKKVLDIALEVLYRTEHELIYRNLHEQTITARLMLHIQHLLPEWFVDVEFNRQGEDLDNVKTDGNNKNRRPDIVIHKRGPAGPNVAVISVKPYWNTEDRKKDEEICKSIREKQGYTLAACVELNKERWRVKIL